jgi:serine/threonine protein kinase
MHSNDRECRPVASGDQRDRHPSPGTVSCLIQLPGIFQCSSSDFVVRFYGGVMLDNDLCLCMEWMDGGSLDRFGRLPPAVLAPVAVSVIAGLRYLWNCNVMHRGKAGGGGRGIDARK